MDDTICAGVVAKSASEGYILMVYSQTLIANAHLHQKLPYDSLKDFIGITPVKQLDVLYKSGFRRV